MHKFLLAENPQAPQSGGLWIVHLPDPVCIIEAVTENEKIHSNKAIYKADFQFKNSDGFTENWQLRIYHYFTVNFDDEKNSEALCAKMLADAWHWFKSYLIWEDQNTDNGKWTKNN